MEIGILTSHCAHNYGTVLQCYALQETLREMWLEVEVINRHPDYMLRPYKVLVIRSLFRGIPLKLLNAQYGRCWQHLVEFLMD